MIATVLALLAPALFAPAPQDAQGEVPPIQEAGDAYILNFSDGPRPEDGMSLLKFVIACEQVTGINFTYTQETEGLLSSQNIKLLGTKRVPKDDFYSFFQIMMIINEFVCTEIGAAPLSVVAVSSLKTQARNTVRGDAIYVEPERLEDYAAQPATLITTVINLPNTDVRQLSNSMRTMITDANTQQMLPAGNTNSMVLTGFGSNVAALARMLKIVDEASRIEPIEPEFELIPLEYASADEIASTIEELLDASRRGQTEAKIMVDPRTNSLLVMAMPEDMPNIKELVARLDVDVIERERSYHIFNLDNVSAEDLSETLNDFLQDASRLEATPAGQGGQTPGRAGGRSGRSTSEFVVVPDVETNSLLIAASRTRYEELLALIQRLDRRQPQVLIETALIELSEADEFALGFELFGSNVPLLNETGQFGGTSFGLSDISIDPTTGSPTQVPIPMSGLLGGIIENDEGDIFFPFLFRAVEDSSNSNVLNVPSVLVNNNGSATVTTTDERPTTQITTNGGVSGQTQENFNDYVEAGITMQISPSISASRYLRLNVFLEVSTFGPSNSTNLSIPPPRNTRTIQTSVNVPDGDTMVIGGIIRDDSTSSEQAVPLIARIPLLGHLFKSQRNTGARTTLYFFVTPHIMDDTDFADLSEVSYQKKLEAADNIGVSRVQVIDPKFGADETGPGLEGFDVPLYSSPERGEVKASDVGLDPLKANELLEQGREQQAEKEE